nr:arsenic resistance protein [Thermosinus carboxydivorans]
MLKKVNQNLIIAIPVAMLLGFLAGIIADTAMLKPWITPLTIVMVYPMMVTLNFKKVLVGKDTKAQVLALLVNFGMIPLLAYLTGQIFFPDEPYLQLGLLIAGLVPTSGMTVSWTGFAKGNVEAATKMTIIGLLAGSLATPFYLQFLLGTVANVDFGEVLSQILTIIIAPMIAGFFTRQLLVNRYGQAAFQKEVAPKFPLVSTVGVLGIVFIAIALKAGTIMQSPELLIRIFIPVMVIYIANFAVSTLVGKKLLPRDDAIALVYGTVMRNLSIALAIAMNTFREAGAEASLVIAAAYIIQVQSAAWYVRFTDALFGPQTGIRDR